MWSALRFQPLAGEFKTVLAGFPSSLCASFVQFYGSKATGTADMKASPNVIKIGSDA